MYKCSRIAMIVEGKSFEPKVLDNIQRCFFSNKAESEYVILTLPAAVNIYVLWKTIREDEDLDIIEVVREQSTYARKKLEGLDRDSFSEVFLFFDYDRQQNNLKANEDPDAVVQSMITLFDNETEQGKLYISYPMAEAIRDIIPGSCRTFSGKCYYTQTDSSYKTMTGANNNPFVHTGSYTRDNWGDIINNYRGRVSCLLNKTELLKINDCKNVSELQLYSIQKKRLNEGIGAEVISAFPRLIIDYFNDSFVEKMIETKTVEYVKCENLMR